MWRLMSDMLRDSCFSVFYYGAAEVTPSSSRALLIQTI